MKHTAQKLVVTLVIAAILFSMLPIIATAAPETHIATYVGEVPEILAADTSITASQFMTPYDAVNVTSNGITYTVEIVPRGTVYFVDSIDKDETKNASTEAYDAVKALLGDRLLNPRNDQYKTEENTWGLMDCDVGVKSYTGSADKMANGYYGAQNAAGETISYQFHLPAGVYRLKSGHTEWWNTSRPMSTKIELETGKVIDGRNISLSGSARLYNEMGFVLDRAQTITYTITATGSQAPVISYVAIDKIGEYTPPSGEAPPKPVLPEGFTEALEDIDGLEMAGAALNEMTGCGKVVETTAGWNNQGSGGANFRNAKDLFGKQAFTLLADVHISATQNANLLADLISAFGIGNAESYVNGFTHSGLIKVGNQSFPLDGFVPAFMGKWNAFALTYQEADGLEGGKLTVYMNGQKAAEIADTGFKFSAMEDLGATLGRSFATNYIMNGIYDNIVAVDSALSEEVAAAETAYRTYQKENLPADTTALEQVIASAKETIAAGISNDELVAVLEQAEQILASEPKWDDQSTVNSAAAALRSAITNAKKDYVIIDGADVERAANNVNGLTYKGFGLLNCNGTSNLLMDYKSSNPDAYWEMMSFLFGGEHPLFSHVKMEMGNDGNNSTAADACTMRWADEEADVSRSPGFAMAADAKKLNPDVKISILNWGQPNWVTNNETKYIWYRETIFDCYEKYGYILDYVNPDVNERNPDATRIKFFANKIENETEFPEYFTQEAIDAYHNIKIVASDENKSLNIVPMMLSDPGVYEAVDAIGFHYRSNATQDYIDMADINDKEVWYSEGCATFGYTELQENKNNANGSYGANTIGGYQSPLALMDHFINSFVASRRTLYIFQPAIGGFYEGIQYAHKELLSARDPWSGYIHYDPALLMLEHFAKFANVGWENESNTKGIWRTLSGASFASYGGSSNEHATAGEDGNASYLTLAAPDKTNFSTIFVNNTRNDKTFKIAAKNLALTTDTLDIWVTETDSYMRKGERVALEDGYWTVTVPAFSILTATTLSGSTPEPLPKDDIRIDERTVLDTDSTGKNPDTTDDYLYADAFDYTDEEADVPVYNNVTGETTMVPYLESRGNEPRYMVDSHGAFVVVDGKLKQLLTSSVSQWNSGDPMTILGDFRWNDYSASVTVSFAEATKTGTGSWAGLTVRSQAGMNYDTDGYTLRLYRNGRCDLLRNNRRVSPENATVPVTEDETYVVNIVARGNVISAYVNGVLFFSYTDNTPWDAGRVKLSCAWDSVSFDDLEIKTLEGGQDYVLTHIDGHDDLVSYEGDWNISGPGSGSADNWYRTLSTNRSAGAKVSLPIKGTGFAIIGGNSASTINVYLDGELVAENVRTRASGTRQATYRLEGLPLGEYDVTVEVVSDTLTIDAFYMLGYDVSAYPEYIANLESDLLDQLRVYRESFLSRNYFDEQLAELDQILSDGLAAIAEAESEKDKRKAYETVVEAMDSVRTKAEIFAEEAGAAQIAAEAAQAAAEEALAAAQAAQAAAEAAQAAAAADKTAAEAARAAAEEALAAAEQAQAAAEAAQAAAEQANAEAAENAAQAAADAAKAAQDAANAAEAQAAAQAAQAAAEAAQAAAEEAQKAAEDAAADASTDAAAAEAARQAAEAAMTSAEAARQAAEAARQAAENADADAANQAAAAAKSAKDAADAAAAVAAHAKQVAEDAAAAKEARQAAEAAALNAEKVLAKAELLIGAAAVGIGPEKLQEGFDAIDAAEDVAGVRKALEEALESLEVPHDTICPSKHFTDVPGVDNWAHAGIDYCVENDLMNGMSETIFSPAGTLTRAQLVTILYRVEGEPETEYKGTFTDVADGRFYSKAIEWAAANEIVNGIGNNLFNPDGEITREQIATILYRYSGSPEVEGDLSEYPDASAVSNYAVNAMLWATAEEIIQGVASDGVTRLEPKANATRAQIATIVLRYLEK